MTYSTSTVLLALSLTLLAGLATGIGSLLAFWTKRTNTRFLAVSLGFSAGVMIYVSFVELLAGANDALTGAWGKTGGGWATVAAFFGGIALIALIDRFVPSEENPHELHSVEELAAVQEGADASPRRRKTDPKPELATLHRTGVFTALAIAIHNFPEGLATFTATLSSPELGVAIAVAIAIHNIPEGIAVAVPLYFATGDRKKAFTYSFLSGLSEPAGALVGYLVLMPFLSPTLLGVVFAGVAGIMVYISLDELLPAAERYGEHHLCIYGLVAGMAVMAVSLLLVAA